MTRDEGIEILVTGTDAEVTLFHILFGPRTLIETMKKQVLTEQEK
jgi:hypothetical protein